MENSKQYLNENQNPKAVQKAIRKVTELLTRDESIQYIAVQKTISLLLLIIISSVYSIESYAQATKLVASHENHNGRRCTGAADCRACSDCSRCKYCNNGGSCGVCSGGSGTIKQAVNALFGGFTTGETIQRTSTEDPLNQNAKAMSQAMMSNTAAADNNKYENQYATRILTVNLQRIDLRSGPGTHFPIIEELTKNQKVVFLKAEGAWVKVRVRKTKSIGYLNYQL